MLFFSKDFAYYQRNVSIGLPLNEQLNKKKRNKYKTGIEFHIHRADHISYTSKATIFQERLNIYINNNVSVSARLIEIDIAAVLF